MAVNHDVKVRSDCGCEGQVAENETIAMKRVQILHLMSSCAYVDRRKETFQNFAFVVYF